MNSKKFLSTLILTLIVGGLAGLLTALGSNLFLGLAAGLVSAMITLGVLDQNYLLNHIKERLPKNEEEKEG